jgi:hypothetical protein
LFFAKQLRDSALPKDVLVSKFNKDIALRRARLPK